MLSAVDQFAELSAVLTHEQMLTFLQGVEYILGYVSGEDDYCESRADSFMCKLQLILDQYASASDHQPKLLQRMKFDIAVLNSLFSAGGIYSSSNRITCHVDWLKAIELRKILEQKAQEQQTSRKDLLKLGFATFCTLIGAAATNVDYVAMFQFILMCKMFERTTFAKVQ
jgi:hypothetical protein